MELKLNSGDVITIPDGCRAVIKDKIITVEKEVQEFEDGDFVSLNNIGGKLLIIYKNKKGSSGIYYHVVAYNVCYVYHVLTYNDWCDCDEARIATEEEKQFLLDAIHADGKDWDAVNKRIVEYMWKPKDGEGYYVINTLFKVLRFTWQSYSFDFDLLKSGNCFKTKEEAEAKAKEILEILKK